MDEHESQLSPQSEENQEMDTVAMAKEMREKQGLWEAEVSYGGEADLHKHQTACEKNPDHKKFIPIDKFNIEHLPLFHDEKLVDRIQALSNITVRVSVKYVSDKRPETYPNSKILYPCYKKGGKKMVRYGTGWLYTIEKFYDLSRKSCTCKECLDSLNPETEFAHIIIHTATHVVFDDDEGKHATCHFFFDRGGTPAACSDVIALSGMYRVKSDIWRDWSKMVFVTHDWDLIQRLDRMMRDCSHLYDDVELVNPTTQTVDDLKNAMTFMVSHPHGCSKQVSLGYCKNRDEIKNMDKFYKYDTPSCPGSSGAPVTVLGIDNNWWSTIRHVHSGNCEDDNGLNHSGFGPDLSDFV